MQTLPRAGRIPRWQRRRVRAVHIPQSAVRDLGRIPACAAQGQPGAHARCRGLCHKLLHPGALRSCSLDLELQTSRPHPHPHPRSRRFLPELSSSSVHACSWISRRLGKQRTTPATGSTRRQTLHSSVAPSAASYSTEPPCGRGRMFVPRRSCVQGETPGGRADRACPRTRSPDARLRRAVRVASTEHAHPGRAEPPCD